MRGAVRCCRNTATRCRSRRNGSADPLATGRAPILAGARPDAPIPGQSRFENGKRMLRASVIIPTRDRAGLLECCLESLTRQTLPRDEFEVLVVDNGSTDSTPEVAKRFSGRLNLVYVLEPEPGLHSGRHAGVRNARADVLLFGEDDLDV